MGVGWCVLQLLRIALLLLLFIYFSKLLLFLYNTVYADNHQQNNNKKTLTSAKLGTSKLGGVGGVYCAGCISVGLFLYLCIVFE